VSDNTERRGTPGFNPPPPLYVAPPTPVFRDEAHRLEYYKEEKRRWIEGYGGLTGAHYFYMTQCYLKDINGNIFRPLWRQVDQLVFEKVESCIKRRKGLMVFKRRDVGLTSIFGGGLPFWFSLTNPGILINMTSKDRDGFVRMFSDKVMICFENMSEDIMNRIPLNKNHTKDNAFLKMGIKKLGTDGVVRLHETTINLVETSENPRSVNKFSSGRAKYTFVDESALHRRIADLLRSMEATQMMNGYKEGFLALGGTIEHTLTNEQIADYQQLMADVVAFDIETIFLPCYMGLITKNGWDDVEAGKAWYYENVEKKSLSSNPSDLRAFKMNFPIDEDDVFQYSRGGMFEDDVVDLLKYQLEKLNKEGTPEAKIKLIDTPEGSVAVPDKSHSDTGFFEVEPPKQGIIYYQAIDSIGAGTREGEEQGSCIASTIYKGFDPDGGDFEPVNTYFERPATVEQGYRNILKQFHRYNKFDGMKEINYEANAATSDHFGTFLEKQGLYSKYAARRKDLSAKGWINTKKRGIAVTEHAREWMVMQANVFLTKYARNIRSKILLQQLLYPPARNADIRDAFFIFLTSIPNFDQPIIKRPHIRERTTVRLTTNHLGQTVWLKEKTQSHTGIPQQAVSSLQAYEIELKQKYGDAYWYNKANPQERERYRELKGTL